jgi:hypothetical protein
MAKRIILIIRYVKSVLIWSIVGLSLLWTAVSAAFVIERLRESQKSGIPMPKPHPAPLFLPRFSNADTILAEFGMSGFGKQGRDTSPYLYNQEEFPVMAAIIIDFIDSTYSYRFWKARDCQCAYAGPNRFTLTFSTIDPRNLQMIQQDSIDGLTAEDLTQYVTLLQTNEVKR